MNNKYGFIIEKLILIGKTVEPAILNFKKGLNVIHGPSDTGKTYAYQCIEYLLHTPEQFGQPADLHPDTLPESIRTASRFIFGQF